jgi:type II secretory pathway component PulK
MTGRASRGFVLVVVLAMLVVLSLLAGTVAAITGRLREQALVRQRQMQDERDMASTRASLLYLLSTQPVTYAGLTTDARIVAARQQAEAQGGMYEFDAQPVGNELAMDARAYRGIGQVNFAVQDDRGLFAVNLQSQKALQRLLAQSGQPQALPAQVLMNRLSDYQDEDDLYQLDSLERDGYRKLGLPPPTNQPLATPMELRRIPGWPEALAFLAGGKLVRTVTSAYSGLVNVNTAPLSVLLTVGTMDEAMASRVMAQRKVQPFLTEHAFYEFAGLPPDPEGGISLYPSDSGTLELWPSRGGQARLLHWTLTPWDDGGRPWREDYELIQPQDRVDGAAALPTAARILAQPVAAQP